MPPNQDIAVLGQTVSAPDGKTIGRLIDVLVGATGKPEAAVIDVGGFMGVGSRKIAVHWNTLHFAPDSKQHQITLELTLDQIKAAPEYNTTHKSVPVVVTPHKPASDVPATVTPATSDTLPAASTHSVGR